MRLVLVIALGLSAVLQSCTGQAQTKKREIYNVDFKWAISIPENFENVSPDEWMRLQNKGKEAIEKTYEGTIENNAKTIFVFRSDQTNYFESNYQPFDTAKDGDYLESFKNVNGILYGTFLAQMPDATLDSASSEETINELTFHTFKVSIHLPNKMVMDMWMYSRLFGKREFTVSILTTDKAKQKLLLDAWRKSKFGGK